jgi:hypothetical protein
MRQMVSCLGHGATTALTHDSQVRTRAEAFN